MFRKPFKVKSNNAIRGSERRKLKDHVSKSFPLMPSEDVSLLVPNKENMSVMNISTYNETTVTCYCLQKNPILFDVNGTLLPTVYTLWKYPQMIISFQTSPNVFPILTGGADLMFPGVLPPPCGFPDFSAKTPSYVTLHGNGAAMAVGVTSCSKEDLIQDGCAGKRVTIFHCYKDHLWSAGEKDGPPLIPDISMIPPYEQNSLDELHVGGEGDLDMKSLNLSNEREDNENSKVEENGNSVDELHEDTNGNVNGNCNEVQVTDEDENNIGDGDVEIKPELTPQETMDLLLQNCFYQALLDAKKVELPILVSKFSSQYLHGACPDGQRIDVKKSSYKKMSVFLSAMQGHDLITVKELAKGVESITAMNIQNERMMAYSQSEFARRRKICKLEKMEEEKEIKKQQNKTIEVRELFAVSAKVAPFFKLYERSKGAVLSSTEIRQLVTGYVKDNELVNSNKKNLINLDPLLTDVLFAKGEHQDTVNWDGIMTRMLKNMNSCHEVVCPGEDPVIRKGKMDFIEVSIENRMGNKKVTVVKNLESFGIETKLFAQSLQQAAASSTAVNPVPGKNSTGTIVIVQGVQMKHVKNILESYKVPLKYVKGLQVKK